MLPLGDNYPRYQLSQSSNSSPGKGARPPHAPARSGLFPSEHACAYGRTSQPIGAHVGVSCIAGAGRPSTHAHSRVGFLPFRLTPPIWWVSRFWAPGLPAMLFHLYLGWGVEARNGAQWVLGSARWGSSGGQDMELAAFRMRARRARVGPGRPGAAWATRARFGRLRRTAGVPSLLARPLGPSRDGAGDPAVQAP